MKLNEINENATFFEKGMSPIIVAIDPARNLTNLPVGFVLESPKTEYLRLLTQ